MSCPEANTREKGSNCFFCPEGVDWDAHRIGWAVAGGSAAITTLVTLFTLTMHATHYQQPAAQRQVMRVLMMPPVYAIVSFFSYRFYRQNEYYVLAETAYEAITLSAFLMLLMELVAMRTTEKRISEMLKEKDKRKFPFPLNCWRFRASKPYFMHTLSFSVMQYVIIRPLISIVGIVCEYYGYLCTNKYSIHYAEVYLEAADFISISFALYGLVVFYVLCKDELKGRRPLNKFLAIKLIVFFTFYQSFVFSALQKYNVIKPTVLWTADNVSDGLSALATTIEMVVFSIYMGWAYSWGEYTSRDMNPYQRQTGVKTYFQAIWDTINLSDFFVEIWLALKFFVAYLLGRPGTRSQPTKMQKTFMPHTIGTQDKLPLSSFDGVRPEESPPPHVPTVTPIENIPGHATYPPGSQKQQDQWGQDYPTNAMGHPCAPHTNDYPPRDRSSPAPIYSPIKSVDYSSPPTSPHSPSHFSPQQPIDYSSRPTSPQSPSHFSPQQPVDHYSPTRTRHSPSHFSSPHIHPSPSRIPHSPSRFDADQNQTAISSPPSARSQAGFPSPHPTGPAPNSAHSYGTNTSGTVSATYITPTEWHDALQAEQAQWPDAHSVPGSERSAPSTRTVKEGEGGIPGNPRLY